MPIGYALLEICVWGPQFREMAAANLAAFASASAGGHRYLNRLPADAKRYSGPKSLP
jgi:hypothetical protein